MRRGFLALLAALAAGLSGTAGSARPRPTGPAPPPVATLARAGTHHYLYVFPDGEMDVYDIDRSDRLVEHVALPGLTGIRGVVASPRTHTLYISHGGDSYHFTGALTAIDLLTGRTLWTRSYPRGVDSPAINASGTRIYMPDGELSGDGLWTVLDGADGSVVGQIAAGIDPHNTVVGLTGRAVYLGGAHTPFLDVASTADNRIIRRIGPLQGGVRPFTVNGRETLAFTTATGFLGFQVSSIRTGRVLYTRTFGPRFRYDPATFAPTAPSHGISLSPDERQVWVIDGPNSAVHVFSLAGLPRRGPRRIADIRLHHTLTGTEAACLYDCARDGWLLHSRSGCQVFVGDSGDVIDSRRLRITGFIPALANTRKFIEIDWRAGLPVATTSRQGMGYVTSRRTPAQEACR